MVPGTFRLLRGIAILLAGLAACRTADPVRTRNSADFYPSQARTFAIAPLKRTDGSPVRPEIRQAVESAIVAVFNQRGLQQATDGPADLTVAAQGGIRPRSSPEYARFTTHTGIPVVEGHSFDIDEQNDATLTLLVLDNRLQKEVWRGTLTRSFVSRLPSPGEVDRAVREILARLPAR